MIAGNDRDYVARVVLFLARMERHSEFISCIMKKTSKRNLSLKDDNPMKKKLTALLLCALLALAIENLKI